MKQYKALISICITLVTIVAIACIVVSSKKENMNTSEKQQKDSISRATYNIEQNIIVHNHYDVKPSSKPTQTPEEDKVKSYYIKFTDEEIIEFAKLLWYECRGECRDCQRKTASAIVNRVKFYNKSLHDVIYEDKQFEPAELLETSGLSGDDVKEQVKVVKYVMKNGPIIPEYVLYFREGHYHDWKNMIDYSEHCTTYFSYDYVDYVTWCRRNNKEITQ